MKLCIDGKGIVWYEIELAFLSWNALPGEAVDTGQGFRRSPPSHYFFQ